MIHLPDRRRPRETSTRSRGALRQVGQCSACSEARRLAGLDDDADQFRFGHDAGPARITMIDRMSRLEYRESEGAIKEIARAYISETGERRQEPEAGAFRASRHPRRARLVGLLGLFLAVDMHHALALEITGDHRLIERFIEDPSLVQKAWLGVTGRYEAPSGGRDFHATLVAAFRLGHDVEVGTEAGFIERRRNDGETLYGTPLAGSIDSGGLADVLIYGKYRVLRGPFEMALGANAILPVAEADRGLGPGNLRVVGFAAFRKGFHLATLVGSLGVTDRSSARGPGEVRGRVAAVLGAGVLVPLSYDWTFLGEATYNGARYEGDTSDARLLAGLDWRPTPNIVFRGSFARGLTDGTPPRSATLSAVFCF